MSIHPKDVGDRTTLAVMLALGELGYDVSMPFGENTRYDLILDDGETLTRVQCKTGRIRKETVEFSTASSYAHHPNEKKTQRHYRGQADLFAVHCGATGGIYLVPVDDVGLDRGYLRLSPPKNNQRRGIHFASDYAVARVECVRVEED